MRAEIFVNHLRKAMPSHDALDGYGLDEKEIQEIQATFLAPEKEEKGGGSNEELEKMISRFDCSRLEIGLINFKGEIDDYSEGRVFAFCEADPLLIRRDGIIAMVDHSDQKACQIECAMDSERFLDALSKFIDIRVNKLDWVGKSEEAAHVCAKAAGGSKYIEFFLLMCGFLN